MCWIFMSLYIVFFIIQIFNLFMALKNKDNKHWINLFSIAVGSMQKGTHPICILKLKKKCMYNKNNLGICIFTSLYFGV